MELMEKQKAAEVNKVRFTTATDEMEAAILNCLSTLEEGFGMRKWAIAKKTGIEEDIVTVLLKRLKMAGKVQLIMIWSDTTGMPNGSGYCLTGRLG
jgi:hypothetical protein